MNEFELIARLCRDLPTNPTTRVGPGDDCAVVDFGWAARWLLFKTDAVVEGVHFTATDPPARVGRKALARALSDVAAMAGTPSHALLTLGMPPKRSAASVQALYRGLADLAREHRVAVAGGETVSSPDRLFLSVSLLGWVPSDRCILRSGAKVGDAVFVTGELGGSRASGRHLDFEPRLEEGRWLAAHFKPTAMIDLSDGLAGDLPHVLKASSVGAEILAEAIPVSRAAKVAARQTGRPALVAALGDGEDFELLFTVKAGRATPLLAAWKQRFPGLRLSCIGQITAGTGVSLRDRRGARPLDVNGYVHFQES